jgi:hypothetical protein
MRLAAPFVVLVAALAAAPAQAFVAQLYNLNPSARLVDFGAGLFPDGTPITSQFAGVTFTNASYVTAAAPNNNVVGGHIVKDAAAGPPDTLRIRFAHSISDVGFAYHQIGTTGPTTIRAKYQGFVFDVVTIVWNETQPNNHFGFLNCWLDELEIDFVGDFRLDSLAYNPTFGASCNGFYGTGVNPPAFTCATLPILGGTWHGAIATTPDTVSTALVFAPAGVLGSPVPLFGGELLVDPAQGLVAFLGRNDYPLAIPSAASSWLGTQLVFQGVRLDVVGGAPTFVPLNAMLLILGL